MAGGQSREWNSPANEILLANRNLSREQKSYINFGKSYLKIQEESEDEPYIIVKLRKSSFQIFLNRSIWSSDEGVMIKTMDGGQAAKLGSFCLSCHTSLGGCFFTKILPKHVKGLKKSLMKSWEAALKKKIWRMHHGSRNNQVWSFSGQTGKVCPCRVCPWFRLPMSPRTCV